MLHLGSCSSVNSTIKDYCFQTTLYWHVNCHKCYITGMQTRPTMLLASALLLTRKFPLFPADTTEASELEFFKFFPAARIHSLNRSLHRNWSMFGLSRRLWGIRRRGGPELDFCFDLPFAEVPTPVRIYVLSPHRAGWCRHIPPRWFPGTKTEPSGPKDAPGPFN